METVSLAVLGLVVGVFVVWPFMATLYVRHIFARRYTAAQLRMQLDQVQSKTALLEPARHERLSRFLSPSAEGDPWTVRWLSNELLPRFMVELLYYARLVMFWSPSGAVYFAEEVAAWLLQNKNVPGQYHLTEKAIECGINEVLRTYSANEVDRQVLAVYSRREELGDDRWQVSVFTNDEDGGFVVKLVAYDREMPPFMEIILNFVNSDRGGMPMTQLRGSKNFNLLNDAVLRGEAERLARYVLSRVRAIRMKK